METTITKTDNAPEQKPKVIEVRPDEIEVLAPETTCGQRQQTPGSWAKIVGSQIIGLLRMMESGIL